MRKYFDHGGMSQISIFLVVVLQIRLSSSTAVISQLGKFSIQKNTRINQMVNASAINTVRSLIECSRQLSGQEDSCAAAYNNLTQECQLYTSGCCTINTQSFLDSIVIRRDLTGFKKNNEDCTFYKNVGNVTGTYIIYPSGIPTGISVYCDMDTDGGGWTVIQHRFNGNINFYRTWNDYKIGFGNLNGEFWLGNENIHQLTSTGRYVLRVDIEDVVGTKKYAKYYTFTVAGESDRYRLTVGEYCGDSGDALFYNNNKLFHTLDLDTTVGFNGNQCSKDRYAGWWFGECTWANLNGRWMPGVNAWDSCYWYQWKMTESLSKISLKIRRK